MDGGLNSCLECGTWGTNWWRLEEGQFSKPVSLLTVSRWHPTMLALSWVTTSPIFPKSPAPWLTGNPSFDPNWGGTGNPGGGCLSMDSIGRDRPSGGLCMTALSGEVVISGPELGRSPFKSLARVLKRVAIIWLIWKSLKWIEWWHWKDLFFNKSQGLFWWQAKNGGRVATSEVS